jgi:hypothetical protein
MPHHWIRISTGTPPRLRDHVRNPPEFDRELRKIVTESGGEPVHVFDGELADPKTCRADLLTADEQAESWESPEQQYDPGSPSEAT